MCRIRFACASLNSSVAPIGCDVNNTDVDIAGWYGKIPSLGDFASRRLPQSFVERWDDWLQRGMTASQAALGDAWLSTYLSAPIWRFLLLPGICDNRLWAGTLMPSVDKVGRYFPLTLVTPLLANASNFAAITSATAWYAELEKISLTMLDVNATAEYLEQSLSQLAAPTPHENPPQLAQQFAHWWSSADTSPLNSIELPAPYTLSDLIKQSALEIVVGVGSKKSLWWRSERLHCFPNLPSAEQFSGLLKSD